MSNLATVTHLRPSQRPVERRVAEVEDGYTRLAMPTTTQVRKPSRSLLDMGQQ